ncbi:polysaccharide pyruvyl transferase CsaB [Halanaerobaculum tunisiense]
MPQVVLSGYYGFNNAGDEAILAALISGLQREVDDVELVVLSADPEWTSQVHGVRAVARYNLGAISNLFRRTDLLISGGGSLLQDVTSRRTIPYYLGVIKLAHLLQVPVFCCGQGIGPITSYWNRKLVQRILNQVAAITVRDQASRSLLQELGVRAEIQLTADPVFTLQPVSQARQEEILAKEGVTLTSPVIGVAPRAWQENTYLSELAKLLDQLHNQLQAEILFIPLQYPADREMSYQLQGLMTNSARIITGNYTPRELLSLVEEVDLLVGVRLHSLIFAALMGAIPAGISYDPKVDHFLERVGLEPVGEIDSLGVQAAHSQIISLWEQKKELKATLQKKTSHLAGLAQQNLEISLRLLSDFL